MNVLQSIIKKVKNLTSEVKFRRSLCNFLNEQERMLEEAREDFETNIINGDAKGAFFAYRRIKMWEEKLKEVKDFNNYMNSSVLEECEAA